MMLEHLGCQAVHDEILHAIESVLKEGSCRTRDMGGNASTTELTEAILQQLQ